MWPAQIKEEFKQIPAGAIILNVDAVERVNKATRNSAVEKAVEKVTLTVAEPEQFADISTDELFWIGSDTDPLAVQEETRSKGGASKFKAFARAAGVEIEGQDEEMVRSTLKDQKVGAFVTWKVNAEGFVRANVSSWFTPGERQVEVNEEQMKLVREQAQSIQQTGGLPRGGALPPRLAQGRAGSPPPPARPAGAGIAPPPAGRSIGGR